MSRSSAPRLTSLLLLLMLPPLLLSDASVLPPASKETEIGCNLRSCAALDLATLQDYVSRLNTTVLVLNETEPSECTSVELLPFGSLPSDWTRLLLLQNSQPEGTPLYDNLLRLSRLMLTAYFESEDRNNWGIQLTDDDYRLNSNDKTIDNLTVVPYTEDRQANNVTLNSTVQKENTWFNTSYNVVNDAHNNEKQLSLSEDANEQTTESYYDFSSFTIGTTNFDESFFNLEIDNENYENNSNETLSTGNNGDKSSLHTTRTSLDSFVSTTAKWKEIKEDKNNSSSSIIIEDSFASLMSSDEEFLENSSANEAIHERSKESFTNSRLRIKNNENKSEKNNESNLVSFFENDKSMTGYHIKSIENSGNPIDSFDHNFESKDRENLLAQSIEDFFVNEDAANETGVLNFINSTDLVSDEVENRSSMNSENKSSEEELLTKSIEDFFALGNNSNDTVTISEKIHGIIPENSFEASNETSKLIGITVTENFFEAHEDENEITSQVPFNEWNKQLEETTDNSNEILSINSSYLKDIFTENFTSIESATKYLLSTNFNISSTTQKFNDLDKYDWIKSDESFKIDDYFDVISSASAGNSPVNISNITGLDSTNEEESVASRVTLVQLISRNFSDVISLPTTTISNETVTVFDIISSLNETEDPSANYSNISLEIPFKLRNTMNHSKTDNKVHIPVSKYEDDFRNGTINLTDDSFWKTTFKQHFRNNWSPTTARANDSASSNESNNSSEILRNILMKFRHDWNNKTSAITKLKRVKDSFWRENADDDKDQNADDINTWRFGNKDGFDLTATSLSNEQYKRNYEISATEMNKRKLHLSAEPQTIKPYQTLFERESSQTQFDRKKMDHDTRSESLQVIH